MNNRYDPPNNTDALASAAIAGISGLLSVTLLIAAVALAVLALGDDPDHAKAEAERYCRMVELHRADPSVGWPDFNNSYDSECKGNDEATR